MHKLIIVILAFLLFSCSEDQVTELNEPTNLSIEITIDTENLGLVYIDSKADNTIEYQLFIESNTEPIETNATGTFQYVFEQEGTYMIEIRAYGLSGRYIKGTKEISISFQNEIEILPEDGYTTPLTYTGYNLVWNDEFNSGLINSDYWNFEIGTGSGGWGNNELQYYRKENATIENGLLTIEAKKETYQGNIYTSSRMTTQGKKTFKYGRIDIKALLPKGQGLWPALWMLGANITSVGWPQCGEIDIMEMIGGSSRENITHGTLHWDNGDHMYTGGSYVVANETFANKYHVFTIIWDENSIKWYVDDYKFHEIDITETLMTEFHEEYFFIFNVAVGGNWPGSPNSTTVFPQQMKVDYIRVFQPI